MTPRGAASNALPGTAPEIVLEARGLMRAFGGVKAVDGLDIDLWEGGSPV